MVYPDHSRRPIRAAATEITCPGRPRPAGRSARLSPPRRKERRRGCPHGQDCQMPPRRSRPLSRFPWLVALACALPLGLLGAADISGGSHPRLALLGAEWEPFGFLTSGAYGTGEKL